jgi:hypothetical protein
MKPPYLSPRGPFGYIGNALWLQNNELPTIIRHYARLAR